MNSEHPRPLEYAKPTEQDHFWTPRKGYAIGLPMFAFGLGHGLGFGNQPIEGIMMAVGALLVAFALPAEKGRGLWSMFVLAALTLSTAARGQEENIPCERISLTPQQSYFLIGNQADKPSPLLLILPGGDGSAEFNPFVKRIWQNALPSGWLAAQLVAVPSDKPNAIIWPTEKSKDARQNFTTEGFIAAVVADVQAKRKVDPEKVYALAWSSSGPAVYATALMKQTPLRGSLIAMSVFMPASLPPVANAKGRKFYLLQSPQDTVTKFFFAQTAKKALTAAGATVELQTYDGGHGWQGDVFGNIGGGVNWLDTTPTTQAAH